MFEVGHQKVLSNYQSRYIERYYSKKIKDKDVLWLLGNIIDSVPDKEGVPIGNYLSQYFANLYLAYFDHWIKEFRAYYWTEYAELFFRDGGKADLRIVSRYK